MLSTKEFGEFAKEFVVFAHVTTRIEGRKDDDLLQKKGGQGFPHLVALDANGDVIAKLTGDRTVEGFRAMMADGAKFVAVREKKEKTLDDEVFLLRHDISMGNADLAQAKARAEAMKGLSDAQKKELDGALLGLEIQGMMPRARTPEEQKAQVLAAGAKFAEMWAAGREPTSDEAVQPFFIFMLDHAEATKDAELFGKALEKLRAKFGTNPNAAKFFERQDARLAALKGAGAEAPKDGPAKDGPAKDGGK